MFSSVPGLASSEADVYGRQNLQRTKGANGTHVASSTPSAPVIASSHKGARVSTIVQGIETGFGIWRASALKG